MSFYNLIHVYPFAMYISCLLVFLRLPCFLIRVVASFSSSTVDRLPVEYLSSTAGRTRNDIRENFLLAPLDRPNLQVGAGRSFGGFLQVGSGEGLSLLIHCPWMIVQIRRSGQDRSSRGFLQVGLVDEDGLSILIHWREQKDVHYR
jgi:hypothetical protein